MVKSLVKVHVNANDFEIKDHIQTLANSDVLVGIPQKESSRKGEKINNAELLFIHTNGSPLRNIPARPVLQPAIENKATNSAIVVQLDNAIRSLLNGDDSQYINSLNSAGMIAQNASRRWFVNPENGWAPNAMSTIKAKGSNKPLIDTGEMRKAIVYVVRGVYD